MSFPMLFQTFYDFGMRTVKSTVVAASNLKRAQPYVSEDELIMQVCCEA